MEQNNQKISRLKENVDKRETWGKFTKIDPIQMFMQRMIDFEAAVNVCFDAIEGSLPRESPGEKTYFFLYRQSSTLKTRLEKSESNKKLKFLLAIVKSQV